MKILVTGSAGFIGSNLVLRLLGVVPVTYADTTNLERDFGFRPQVTLREEPRKFAEWYKEFYKM